MGLKSIIAMEISRLHKYPLTIRRVNTNAKTLVIVSLVPEELKLYLIDAGTELSTRCLLANNHYVGATSLTEAQEDEVNALMEEVNDEVEQCDDSAAIRGVTVTDITHFGIIL